MADGTRRSSAAARLALETRSYSSHIETGKVMPGELMNALSSARVTLAPVVSIHEDGFEPSSRFTFVTEPETVSVSVPADGVKVRETRVLTPAPYRGPAVDAPERVIRPVPLKLSV
jgi:hypothetical protein